MKKWFLGLIALLLALSIAVILYPHYQQWQQARRAEALKDAPTGKLPEWVLPKAYSLWLRLDPNADDYRGRVIIDVELLTAADHVWLHGEKFTVDYALVTDEKGQKISANYQEIANSGIVKLSFNQMLHAQPLRLEIAFRRDYERNLSGLYRVEAGGYKHLFTQFEAIDARKAFPSFDEPRFKTPFRYQLEVPTEVVALTNTPELKRQTLDDGFVRIDYAESKPLPTYLVAFAVGYFDSVEAPPLAPNVHRDREIPVRGFAIKGKGKDLRYAVEHTHELVYAMENYFGRGYPYDKLDFIAVPDFAAGAMENAGLITYREQLLLLGDTPSLEQQKSYYGIHAHELAHQWFGNLVTMPWWDDIWLNESFATWMASKVVHQLRPDLDKLRDDLKSVYWVMNADTYNATRRIREPIINNGDIDNAFDGITYIKGGAILSMFESFMGESLFRKGVQRHLRRFEFANATAEDFIDSMVRVSNKPEIGDAFNDFLNQSGVPLVRFDWQCKQHQSEKSSAQFARLSIQLQQQKYLPLGVDGDPDYRWHLPFCFSALTGSARKNFCLLFDKEEAQYHYPVNTCPDIVFANSNGASYVRITQPEEKWQSLLTHLQQLNSFERIALNSNLLAELKAGRLSASILLQAAAAFAKLEDLQSRVLPIDGIEYLAKRVANDEERKALNRFAKVLYRNDIERLGIDADTQWDISAPAETAKVRKQLLTLFALSLKDPLTRQQLTERAKRYVGFAGTGQLDKSAINPDLAALALQVATQELGAPFFDYLESLLDNNEDGTMRRRLLTAMASATDLELSERVLTKIVSTETRLNEKPLIVWQQMQMPETRLQTFNWLKNKYDLIAMFLPEQYLAYAPRLGAYFCDEKRATEVETFFRSRITPGSAGERQLAQTLERIKSCTAIKNTVRPIIVPQTPE